MLALVFVRGIVLVGKTPIRKILLKCVIHDIISKFNTNMQN